MINFKVGNKVTVNQDYPENTKGVLGVIEEIKAISIGRPDNIYIQAVVSFGRFKAAYILEDLNLIIEF